MARSRTPPCCAYPVPVRGERTKWVSADQGPPGIAYTRYYTLDRFDRRITFYMDGNQNERLPFVVSVSGSDAFSNFARQGDRILDAHRTEREVFSGKAHILIVEKPGVEFLEQHADRGTASRVSAEFRRQRTLDR